jgi:hypothetical protein
MGHQLVVVEVVAAAAGTVGTMEEVGQILVAG